MQTFEYGRPTTHANVKFNDAKWPKVDVDTKKKVIR